MPKPDKNPGIPFLTPNDVAVMSGKSLIWIRQNIRAGRLQATSVGGRYFITQEDYDRWHSDQRPAGRPRKQGNA